MEKNKYETEEGYLNVPIIWEEVEQFAFLVGARNVGKTYGFLNFSIKRGLDTILECFDFSTLQEFKKLPTLMEAEFQFLFLRRYITQAKSASRNLVLADFYQPFLDKLPEEVKKQYEVFIEYQGSSEEPREILLVFRNKELKKDKKCIKLGYLGAVSMAEKFRGPGLPKVKVILLDEFQSKKNWDYLPNEPVELEDIYESVGRLRCGTGDIKVIALGNSGTILNPYFDYYGYDEFTEVKTVKREGEVLFYHLPNKAKRSEQSKNLFKGSAYGKYSLDNDFADNQLFNVIRLKEAKAPRKCLYNIFFGETYIGVWRTGDYKILISRVSDPDKLDIVDRTPIEEQVLDQQVYRVLSDKLQNKQLYFDSPELRLIAEKHLRKYIYNSASEWETF
ncbi:phage DNA encapsidation protein [Enterococcus faecalis]|uniref:phage DNA encapsidation protein n=1 Tax=Enterococcus faecalis TaxID=1351 RepID=UPI000352E728|nr:phage DNA encapsidation protein [Enterococcus faecalis]EPI40624.1 hypothetical protein D347_00028 [Enterococcus faecalis LA3B-2]